MGGLHGTAKFLRGLLPLSQKWAPNTCLDSAELLLRPGQAPGVVSMSILLLAHGGRCPQALVPQQGPRASSSSGPQPCRNRMGVRKPGGNSTALYGGFWLRAWKGDYLSWVEVGGDQGQKL